MDLSEATEAEKTSNHYTSLFTEGYEALLTDHFTKIGQSSDVVKKFTELVFSGKNVWDRENLHHVGITNEADRQLWFREFQRNLELHNSKVFQDPLHDSIELHPLLVKIVDTPQFQRMRDIKQLGGVYYVYPGASHNRFEHSIGVCYLAGKFIKSLRYRQPELGIDDRDALCVKIAALCHDMGHGPFSHLYQDLFIKEMRKGRQWKHEEASVALMDHMMSENHNLDYFFQLCGLKWEQDRVFIQELIYGEPIEGNEFKGREKNKHFLYEIVANKVTAVDVDKMDYLIRDSHGLGITVKFDWKRYMKFARVISNKRGTSHICPRDKEVREVYELFHIRDHLFRAAYQHKTKRAVEFLILEAMKEADEHLKLPGKEDGKLVKMSEAIDDMEAFTVLTDSVIYAIAFHPDEKLKKARQILAEVKQRQLYVCVGRTIPLQTQQQHPEDGLHEVIFEKYKKHKPNTYPAPEKEHFIIDFVKFDYGFGDKDPVENVWFYRKALPDKPMTIKDKKNGKQSSKSESTVEQTSYERQDSKEKNGTKASKLSAFLPREFEEHELRVYSKERDQDIQDAIHRGFKEVCKSKGLTKLFEDVDSDEKISPESSVPSILPRSHKTDNSGNKRKEKSKLSSSKHLLSSPDFWCLFTTAMFILFIIWFSLPEDLNSRPPHGVKIIKSKQFTVFGSRGVNFDWEEYGIWVSIPDSAIPNGFISTVTVHVSVSGPYVFPNPEKWKIASAVYWISSTKDFLLPVMVRIKHTMICNDSSKARFLRATHESINGVFEFFEEPGGHFSIYDSHGYIYLDHFSGYAVSSDEETDELFYGRLLWKKMSKVWFYNFLIHRHFAKGIFKDLLKEYDGWQFFPETAVVFENDEVELILDNEDKCTWNLASVYDPLKYSRKQLLQSMEITSNIQFMVWQNNPTGIGPLIISLPLTGTKQPKRITLPVDPGEQREGLFSHT